MRRRGEGATGSGAFKKSSHHNVGCDAARTSMPVSAAALAYAKRSRGRGPTADRSPPIRDSTKSSVPELDTDWT